MHYSKDFQFTLVVIACAGVAFSALSFSLPLLALDVSQDGAGLALVKGVGFVPNVLFAVFIGVINDRMIKELAFRRYSLGLAALTLVLLALVLTGRVSLLSLSIFMIAFNGLSYALGNVQGTLLRMTVAKEHLSDATAATSAIHAAISVAGPAFAGLLLVLLSHSGLIALCAAILLVATILAARIRVAEELPPKAPFLHSLKEGWQVFRANRELVMMTIVIVLTNAAAGAFETGIILKMKVLAGFSEFQIGLVFGVAGAGALLASRVAAPLRRRLGYRVAFYWPILMLVAVYLVAVRPLPFWGYCAVGFMEGALSLFFAIGVWSYRQESTEARYMGRVAGLTGAIFKIGMPPVIFFAGVLSDWGQNMSVFYLVAGINFCAALFLSTFAGWGVPRRAV